MKQPKHVNEVIPSEGIFREEFEKHIMPGIRTQGYSADSGFAVTCAIMYFLGVYAAMAKLAVDEKYREDDFIKEFEIQREHQMKMHSEVLGKPH